MGSFYVSSEPNSFSALPETQLGLTALSQIAYNCESGRETDTGKGNQRKWECRGERDGREREEESIGRSMGDRESQERGRKWREAVGLLTHSNAECVQCIVIIGIDVPVLRFIHGGIWRWKLHIIPPRWLSVFCTCFLGIVSCCVEKPLLPVPLAILCYSISSAFDTNIGPIHIPTCIHVYVCVCITLQLLFSNTNVVDLLCWIQSSVEHGCRQQTYGVTELTISWRHIGIAVTIICSLVQCV